MTGRMARPEPLPVEPAETPHASGFAVESRRVLFTLAGVAIGVGVMLLANPMKERAAKASGAQPAAT
jgi:hypothetical protein